MSYLEEMKALTEEREAFNERTRALHEERGLPPHIPLVVVEGDAEMEQYIAEGTALVERERAFDEKYMKPGLDPHTIV